jgi:hypothetical protein
MEKFKFAFVMIFMLILWSCKKEENPASTEIKVQDVYITSVQAQRVDIVYKLSHLGYKETGVIYFPKDRPTEQHTAIAIRKNDQFNLSLNNLDPNTEYVLKVYHKTNQGEKKDEEEFVVKTLSATSLKFNLEISNSEVAIHDGRFKIEIEGDYLNELNLSELNIKVNDKAASIAYPVQIAAQRYKMTISGQAQWGVSGHLVTASYREEEILAHYIPIKSDAERYVLNAKAVNLPPGWYSAYKNKLYSFIDEQVLRWDEANYRMVTLRSFEEGFIWGNTPCFEFDNQMFFVPSQKGNYPDPKNPSKYERYLEVVSYSPEGNIFNDFPLLDRTYDKELTIETSQFFVHKSEMYLAFTLADMSAQYANKPITRTNLIYKYNRSRKQFEYVSGLNTDILSYHFTSINNQIYLIGLVPVTDQGFQLTSTFGAFKVSDAFDLEPIYTEGTLTKPIKFPLKGIAKIDDKILIVAAIGDFKIFDPINRVLHQVNVSQGLSGQYYNGLFTYNNMLHINIDAGFTSQMIYELSVSKENK